MTPQLYIDNQLIVFPDNFSFPLVLENPVYTKSSEYTYDLTLSLLKAPNAKAYHYINRTHIINGIQYKRSAKLIVGNRVYLNGTEVILEFGNDFVKIQLLSGNAEFNFVAGGKKKLRDLKLGSATPFIHDLSDPDPGRKFDIEVFQSLKHSYPARDWHLLPYYAGIDQFDNRIHGNRYMLYPFDPEDTGYDGAGWDDRDALYRPTYSGQVPQPYLCFIIEKAIKALGYTLTHNALAEHPILKDLYIVHGVQTMEFAKMLPVWTVDEFFSKIELQYDCVFVVDANTKEIQLLFNHDAQINQQTISLKVIDQFTNTIDEENKLDVRIANIAYNLDSDEYYDFMNISERIIQKSIKVKYDTLNELFPLVQNENDKDRFKKIFTDGYDQYIAYRTGENIGGKEEVIPRRINSFTPLMNNPESTEIDQEFDIIPAAMVCASDTGGFYPNGSILYTNFQFPVAGNYDPLFGFDGLESTIEEEIIDIQALVEGDVSLNEEDTSYTKMRMAIYSGLSELDMTMAPNQRKSRYPIAYVESLAEYFEKTGIIRYYGPIGGDPFRLKNLNREIYEQAATIDTTETYKYSFELEDNIDIRSNFIINNKRFVCYKIEREVTPLGFAPLAIGYFYPYTAKEEA